MEKTNPVTVGRTVKRIERLAVIPATVGRVGDEEKANKLINKGGNQADQIGVFGRAVKRVNDLINGRGGRDITRNERDLLLIFRPWVHSDDLEIVILQTDPDKRIGIGGIGGEEFGADTEGMGNHERGNHVRLQSET